MPHFFIKSSQIENSKIIIPKGENYSHLKQSLRVSVGEKLLFIDENYIQYEAVVEYIGKDFISASIIKSYKSERFAKSNIYLAQSVLKNDAQNYVIQKATELGVKGIYPLITDNCVIKQNVAEQKLAHWQKISYEASKQCERPDVPIINPVRKFDFILNNNDFEHIFVFVERNSSLSLKEFLHKQKISFNDKILLVIGPEGGFSAEEFRKFDEYNLPKLTLGSLILRADTAVIAAVSNVLYELG